MSYLDSLRDDPGRQPGIRTGRRKRPTWARSDAALAEKIIGQERIAKIRRALESAGEKNARLEKLRTLVSAEMLHRFNVASLYYSDNKAAKVIAEQTGKTVSAVQSLIYKLQRALKTVSSPLVRGAISEMLTRDVATELEQALKNYERKVELCIDGYKLASSGLNSGRPRIVDMARKLLPKVQELDAELRKDRDHLEKLLAELEAAEGRSTERLNHVIG